ncbi:hemagglutinin repeat-containing protein [Acidovorax sp. NCPPB 3576]|uniref:hemagglutinin repeat-containing protein n=1 Tax=Acidovorax sp. NCPPB 3576 TaxID=2940488 RepID=UPI00234BB57F|nr:hemagglutinin repeat-containing protein [Acidovorax sp. NCPPB 3576]WCM88094.1 hemagglutinin repeat-containing protein [Acidovorax sp. NCPPB 3576]
MSVADTATDHRNESQRAAASSVQAQGGNVALVASNRYEQEGSAVLAKGDVSIVGKTVDIHESRELERDLFETRAKQSGLTVSVGSPLIDFGMTAGRVGRAIGRTSDARTQALGVAAIGLNAYNNAKDLGNAGQALLNGDPLAGASVSVSISLGSSTSAYQVDSAAGSAVRADGNVHIPATDGDLRVRGSDIEAGKNVGLIAQKGNIVLEASENRFAEKNSRSSSSGSIGVSIGAGGVSVNASASRARDQGSAFLHDEAHRNG